MRIRSAIALAVAGAATTMAFAAPAQATGFGGIGNVDIVVTDIASGNTFNIADNISVLNAAQICQVNVDVITATLLGGNYAKCTSKSNNHQNAYIKKH
jgi:hypothetical protein